MAQQGMDFYSLAIEGGYRILEHLVKNGGINLFTGPKTDSPQEPQEPESTGCYVCKVHEHISVANSLVQGLSKRLNPDGSIPSGLGGTLKIAQDHINEASEEIPHIMMIQNDKLQQACMKLAPMLVGLSIDLNFVSSRQELEAIAVQTQLAEDIAYAVPEAVYRREPPKQEEVRTITLSKSDAEILEAVRKIRENGHSKAESVEELNKLLFQDEETHA